MPLNIRQLCEHIGVEAQAVFYNEQQIIAALGYNLFFTEEDVADLSFIFDLEGLQLNAPSSTDIQLTQQRQASITPQKVRPELPKGAVCSIYV
ncbi:hypothetical protein BLNAU_21655 [Blattamonas nauphoetae]|uniref:Uncharacterized protein n=1 Tax=Blattamonas nauphoetae TaxID=2049346 RepID=A0ABQ9WVS6_9EUKA|nr:hypothetical protein BLNAU_21655 [Blattamonas nauphoetae]